MLLPRGGLHRFHLLGQRCHLLHGLLHQGRQLRKDINVSPRRILEIVKGRRAITADVPLRLSRYFGTSAPFWMNLQTQYELETQEDLLAGRLETEVKVLQPA